MGDELDFMLDEHERLMYGPENDRDCCEYRELMEHQGDLEMLTDTDIPHAQRLAYAKKYHDLDPHATDFEVATPSFMWIEVTPLYSKAPSSRREKRARFVGVLQSMRDKSEDK